MKVAPNTYVYMESYNNMINTGYQFTLETIEGIEMKSKLKVEISNVKVNVEAMVKMQKEVHLDMETKM